MMRLLGWSSWPNLFFHFLCCNNAINKQWLPSNENRQKIRVILHSVALGVSKRIWRLLKLLVWWGCPLCYWATHRLLVIQVNHYCFIRENRNSSLYKSVGPSVLRPVWGSGGRSAPFFFCEGCSVNTQRWPVGFFHLCFCPRFSGGGLQRGGDRWLCYW